MRNVLKAETLERKFPLLSVENGCIVSKDADLTVGPPPTTAALIPARRSVGLISGRTWS